MIICRREVWFDLLEEFEDVQPEELEDDVVALKLIYISKSDELVIPGDKDGKHINFRLSSSSDSIRLLFLGTIRLRIHQLLFSPYEEIW